MSAKVNSSIRVLNLIYRFAMNDDNDIPYIEAAVEIARQSMFESGSVKPLVGAVLTRKGIELGRACRGEIKPGEHAEYTLLKKS